MRQTHECQAAWAEAGRPVPYRTLHPPTSQTLAYSLKATELTYIQLLLGKTCSTVILSSRDASGPMRGRYRASLSLSHAKVLGVPYNETPCLGTQGLFSSLILMLFIQRILEKLDLLYK